MDKYTVKLYARAYQDLEEIYSYIANSLLEPDTALNMVDALETAILSLAQFPERGAIRRVGAYSNKDYRQLFLQEAIEAGYFFPHSASRSSSAESAKSSVSALYTNFRSAIKGFKSL